MNFKELFSVTIILFSVIDIIGSLPIIIKMRKEGVKIESARASMVALLIMSVFLYGGQAILKLFGVDIQSFAVAGAIIMFLIGLEMILNVRIFHNPPDANAGSIVPIAFPLIAGAGSMTTIISLKAHYSVLSIQLAIVLNMIFVYLILHSSNWIGKRLGNGGAQILQKVFGIILLSIAIKMFKENADFTITGK